MIFLLCGVSLALWGYGLGKWKAGLSAVKLAVFSLFGFFSLYTVVSALFFWADCFAFTWVLGVCVLLQLIALAGLWRRLPPFSVKLSIGRYWIPIGIALLALPFTWNKFELYSMGQDQGTYQVKALALMEYDTHNYMEMEEFTKLETPQERQKYLDFVYGQNNLYLPRVIEETKQDAADFDKIVGTIHGLPTYSALLALWGKLFGYSNMIGIQTLFYLCMIFLVYFAAEQMGLSKRSAGFATLLTAFSPISIWCSKSSLTEISLAMCFAAFLYAVTGKRENAGLAWTALVVFAFLHISIYVFMPILIVVLFLLYFWQREKGWLFSVLGTLAGYLLSAFWAFDIAPYYSYGNYSVLWKLSRNLIHENNIHGVILVLCGGLGALAIFLMTERGERMAERLHCLGGGAQGDEGGAGQGGIAGVLPDAEGAERKGLVRLWRLGVRLVLAGSLVFFVYKGVLTAEYVRYCEYLQISTYIYMTGLVLIPFVYVYLFWKPERALENPVSVTFTLLFFYCVIAYSSFMRLDVLFYYYYARYVTIFIALVFLLAGWLLERAEPRGRLLVLLFGLAALSFVPYDKGLIYQKDHTRCEWEVLDDVCEDIGSQDAFIVGPDEQQIVFIFPVKLLTGADVYYADENLRGQMGKLAQQYESIYYLDYDGALERRMQEDKSWQDGELSVEKVYTNWNHLSYLDYFNIQNPLTPIPLTYVEYRLKLSLHQISQNG